MDLLILASLGALILMTGSDWVAIIAAIGTAVTAVMTALVMLLRQDVKTVNTSVDQVHKMVNQQRTDAQMYQRLLVDTLIRSGVKVPIDVSIPPEEKQGDQS